MDLKIHFWGGGGGFLQDNTFGFILGFKVNAFPLITDNYIDYLSNVIHVLRDQRVATLDERFHGRGFHSCRFRFRGIFAPFQMYLPLSLRGCIPIIE